MAEQPNPQPTLYAGVMTGTSLDAIDVALIQVAPAAGSAPSGEEISLAHFRSQAMDIALADGLMELQQSGEDELHRAALLSNALSDAIARALLELLAGSGLKPSDIKAAGIHGQTVRHRPELGYSLQLLNPARIVEAASVTVVSDFRSKDIAAAGQGAPLVPAFHQAIFGRSPSGAHAADAGQHQDICAVVNIGGIANLSWLGPRVLGHDTGPGNMLMNAWCRKHLGKPFDQDGRWAAAGKPHAGLLEAFLAEPFFKKPAPRSTGRDLFDLNWIEQKSAGYAALSAQDVQATLLLLTAQTIAQEIATLAAQDAMPREVLVCGGGAFNVALMERLTACLKQTLRAPVSVKTTAERGWPVQAIEAAAFAWLAHQAINRRPANLPSVTGALGPRILGSITPA